MIRRLAPSDAADMAALHKRAITPYWPETDMAEHARRDICLGIGEPLTGFVILRPAADQAEILTIVTGPDNRGRGIGAKLLQAGENKAFEFGTTIVFLEVAEDNAPAIALYRSADYEPIGKRPAYYRRDQGRVAALTFRKKLDA